MQGLITFSSMTLATLFLGAATPSTSYTSCLLIIYPDEVPEKSMIERIDDSLPSLNSVFGLNVQNLKSRTAR